MPVVLAFSIPLCSNYNILLKPSNTTKYVSLLSLLLSRTTCFGPLSDHHQVFKSYVHILALKDLMMVR